jgi:hypothetical protein
VPPPDLSGASPLGDRTNMTEYKRKKKFIIVLVLSCISFLLIVVEQIVSAYRKELLGYDPRVAGHNFVYNFMIFIPVIIVVFVLSITALIIYVRAWEVVKKSNDKLNWFERLSIVPALVPFAGLLYVVIVIIYFIIRSLSAA